MAMPSDSYSGPDSYKAIDSLIKERGRRRLMVISPYIGKYYARLLVDQSAKKRVSIITSNSDINKDAVSFIRRSKPGSGFIKAAVYFIILEAIFFFLKFYYLEVFVIPVIAVLLVLAVATHSARKSRVALKISDEQFIHEKVYITDDRAIVGSANLTYSGTHKNIEHVEIISDKSKFRMVVARRKRRLRRLQKRRS